MIPLWQWMSLGACLVLSAFFSSAETALTALGEARTQTLIDEGGRGRLLRLWQKQPERILAALLLGNTLVNVATGSLAALVAQEWGFPQALAVLTGVTTLVLLLFGEVTPKTLAKRHAAGYSLTVIPVVALMHFVLYPLSWLLVQIPAMLGRAIGLRSFVQEGVTHQELEYLIEMGARQGSLDQGQEALLSSALAFHRVLVKEIMIPRTQVVALEETASRDEVLRVAAESGLSRVPVFRGSMDEVIGVLHVKRLLGNLVKSRGPFQIAQAMRPALFVPEVMKVSRLLTEMQRRKLHLAVVVDEFGGTSGIVTLEDVVEEIVGEIDDESDAVEEKKLRPLSDGLIVADAQVSLRELEQALGAEFPDQTDYETLGGFLTATAGRVPPAGSLVVFGDFTFTVKAADERRVHKVEIARKPAAGSTPAARPAALRTESAAAAPEKS